MYHVRVYYIIIVIINTFQLLRRKIRSSIVRTHTHTYIWASNERSAINWSLEILNFRVRNRTDVAWKTDNRLIKRHRSGQGPLIESYGRQFWNVQKTSGSVRNNPNAFLHKSTDTFLWKFSEIATIIVIITRVANNVQSSNQRYVLKRKTFFFFLVFCLSFRMNVIITYDYVTFTFHLKMCPRSTSCGPPYYWRVFVRARFSGFRV